MKVFGCKMSGGYRGGIILVAANNVREAYLTASKDKNSSYMFDPCYNEDDLPICDYYPFEGWHEFPHLSYDCVMPQFILEESHIE